MISFIVPCHNYGYNLEKCVKSILSNEKSLIKEILIINDSSTDNTKQVASKLIKLCATAAECASAVVPPGVSATGEL